MWVDCKSIKNFSFSVDLIHLLQTWFCFVIWAIEALVCSVFPFLEQWCRLIQLASWSAATKIVYDSLWILVCDWVLMLFIFLSPACRVRRCNFPCENITNVVITYLLDLGSPMELLWMNDKWVIFLTTEIWGLQFCWIHKVLR